MAFRLYKNTKLNEDYSMNISNIGNIELNDVLIGISDDIVDNIRDKINYWDVYVDKDGTRAYIRIAPKDDIPINDYYIDSDYFVMVDYPHAKDFLEGVDEEDYNQIRDEVIAERDKLENTLIPGLAKRWGFRKIKNK